METSGGGSVALNARSFFSESTTGWSCHPADLSRSASGGGLKAGTMSPNLNGLLAGVSSAACDAVVEGESCLALQSTTIAKPVRQIALKKCRTTSITLGLP